MMNRFVAFGLMCVVLLPAGCKSRPKPTPALAESVALAHGQDEWRKQRALAGRFAVAIDGGPMDQGRFIYEVDSGRLRIDVEDESKTVILSAGSSTIALPDSPHRDFFTRVWPTLLTLPFRLEGAGIQELGEKKIGTTPFRAARFKLPGHDWIEIYVDPAYRRIAAAAYPISGDEARAVTFYDFKQVDAVRFATEWKFWKWSAQEGIYGQPIGGARLSNLEFRAAKKGTFELSQ